MVTRRTVLARLLVRQGLELRIGAVKTLAIAGCSMAGADVLAGDARGQRRALAIAGWGRGSNLVLLSLARIESC